MCDMIPHELVISTGDTHIYSNHIEQMKIQMDESYLIKPKLWINPDVKNKNIEDITIDDFDLMDILVILQLKEKWRCNCFI